MPECLWGTHPWNQLRHTHIVVLSKLVVTNSHPTGLLRAPVSKHTTDTQDYRSLTFANLKDSTSHCFSLVGVHMGLLGGYQALLGFYLFTVLITRKQNIPFSIAHSGFLISEMLVYFIGLFSTGFLIYLRSLHILNINPISYICSIYDKLSPPKLFHSWCPDIQKFLSLRQSNSSEFFPSLTCACMLFKKSLPSSRL